MKGKILNILFAAAMAAVCLTGCGNPGTGAAGDEMVTGADAPGGDAAGAEAPGGKKEAPAGAASEAPGGKAGTDAAGKPQAGAKKTAAVRKVGVAMPTQESKRWISDGTNMKEKLEELGYEVDLRYADNGLRLQASQVKDMIAGGCDCLVVTAADSAILAELEEEVKAAGIPVIAYDRLLMDTDAVSYYATFDNMGAGMAIGRYIVEKKGLEEARETGESYTIEFFMGSPDDSNAEIVYNGIMSELQPYLEDGTLVCKSGKVSFDDVCIMKWSRETARQNCADYLADFYGDGDLDIACSAFDGLSYGIGEALEAAGYTGKNWPLITGQDAEVQAVRDIINGRQAMTMFKDTRYLAEKCVTMVQAVLEGSEPEINDTEQYNNGKMIVPSYLCTPVVIDADNYREEIIGSGYYTVEQLGEE